MDKFEFLIVSARGEDLRQNWSGEVKHNRRQKMVIERVQEIQGGESGSRIGHVKDKYGVHAKGIYW